MQATIGNSLISTLKPQDKQYDVRDSKLTGFLIRVNPSGRMTYVCEYQRGRRINLGRVGVLTPAQARERAKQIMGDAARGIYPNASRGSNHQMTFKEFLEKHYLPWAETNRKSGVNAVARIKRCFYSLFANKTLSEITPVKVEQWRTQRLKEGLSRETMNRDIATFKAALSKAVLWEFIEVHPLAKLKLLKVDNTVKVRYLTEDEENRLRQSLNDREEQMKTARNSANEWRQERNYELLPDLSQQYFADDLKPKLLLTINTGIRRGELINLTWSNVNLTQAYITIAGEITKSGKTRHIPLNEEALITLQQWHNQSDGQLVFPNKDGKPYNNWLKSWKSLLKKANIDHFRWHDLRHHFASRLVMAGVDLNTIRELLGHSDLKMTLRYAHLAPEHKIQAVAKLMKNTRINHEPKKFAENY